MGRRLLIVVLGLLTVLASQLTYALGLGNIELKSNLNEPLTAEIELFEVRGLEESEILVGLASREDFERVGVDKPYFLSDLTFKIILSGSDNAKVQVTSRKAVREPFLNFIVQVQWPSGKLLREYTLLIDLPVFSDNTPQQVTSTPTQPYSQPESSVSPPSPSSTSRYNPRSEYPAPNGQSARPSSAARSQPLQPSVGAGDEVFVNANDTLWEIAARARPDRNLSVQQTMLAIQRINPNAFINNNINLLKEGQVLRIPDRDQIENVEQQSAVAEVAVQNNEWVGGASDFTSDYGPQLEGSKSYNTYESDESESEGRLTLSSPEEASDSYEGRGTGSGGSTEALENELAVTLEQLDKSTKDNTELQSKVASLEEQIETLEKLIEVSNEDLRALELAAQQSKEAEELAEDEAPVDPLAMGLNEEEIAEVTVGDNSSEDDAVNDLYGTSEDDFIDDNGVIDDSDLVDSDLVDSDLVDSDLVDNGAVDEEPVFEETQEEGSEEPQGPEAEEKPDPNKVVVVPSKKESGIVDLLLENIIYIGVLLIALLGGVFYFVRKKSSDDSEDEDDFLSQPLFEEKTSAAVSAEEKELEELEELEEPEAPEDIVIDDEAEPEDEIEEELAEPQTEDVVAEADIYIAYGKYDQAEEMLLNALSNEPANADIRLKLLEVYANQQNAESFDPHLAKLYVVGDQASINRAVQLRDSISGVAEFDESLYDVSDVKGLVPADDTELSEEAFSAEDELDIDLTRSEEIEDDDFSLDLDLGELSSDENEKELSEDETLELNLDFDSEGETGEFDLNLEELDLEENEAEDNEISLSLEDFESEPEDNVLESSVLDDNVSEDNVLELELDTDLSLNDTVEMDSGAIELALDSDDEDDFDLGGDLNDLSLHLEESEVEIEAEPESLESDLAALDHALDSSFELETADELALDDIELEPIKVAADTAELEEDVLPIADSLESAAVEDNLDLGLGDDLDLSALDEELDALTSDLDGDLADIEAELEGLELGLDEEPTSSSAATVMEEPKTDFGDLDDDLELESEATADMGEDTMFQQAISEVPDSGLDFEIPDVDPESATDDEDLGFLSDSDEVATKLDLARAYMDMDDTEGARDIIGEIMKEGNAQQKQEAENLVARLDG